MRNIKCRNCIEYRKDWCHKVNDDPYPDIVRDCQYYREKTNADHIRSMSDEELYEVLRVLISNDVCLNPSHSDVCTKCVFGSFCKNHFEEDVLDWLKQPYGGDT